MKTYGETFTGIMRSVYPSRRMSRNWIVEPHFEFRHECDVIGSHMAADKEDSRELLECMHGNCTEHINHTDNRSPAKDFNHCSHRKQHNHNAEFQGFRNCAHTRTRIQNVKVQRLHENAMCTVAQAVSLQSCFCIWRCARPYLCDLNIKAFSHIGLERYCLTVRLSRVEDSCKACFVEFLFLYLITLIYFLIYIVLLPPFFVCISFSYNLKAIRQRTARVKYATCIKYVFFLFFIY
jgi:hypothetical protein